MEKPLVVGGEVRLEALFKEVRASAEAASIAARVAAGSVVSSEQVSLKMGSDAWKAIGELMALVLDASLVEKK